MKKLLFFFVAIIGVAQAQDAHFSQFYSNPMYLAPSFAGSGVGSRIVANYRDQWPKVPGNYVTYSLSGDHYFSKIRSGMGLLLFSDQAGKGKILTNQFAFLYSYKIPITREFYLQPGLSAYYISRKIDFSMLNFSDQFFGSQFVGTTSETAPELTIRHADFATSILAYTENYWGGATVDHLMKISSVLKTDYRYSGMRYNVFGGAKFITKKKLRNKNNESIHAAFNYRYQSKIHQLDLGAYYYKNPLIFGLWYRGIPVGNTYASSDAIIFLLGIKNRNYSFNYSYDMSLGGLISRTGGSHEISVVYSFSNPNALVLKKRHAALPCPEI